MSVPKIEDTRPIEGIETKRSINMARIQGKDIKLGNPRYRTVEIDTDDRIVTGSLVIAVPERGHVDLPRSIWEKMESVQGFRRLLDRGVLPATLLPGRGVRVHGSCYVGCAQCGELILELREKIDGALVSLLGHATHDAFKMERAEARLRPNSAISPHCLSISS